MVRDFTFYVISVFACGNVMLLMLVIFGKFGSFLGVEAFKGGGGEGGRGAPYVVYFCNYLQWLPSKGVYIWLWAIML